jgi:hypothetical protein
VGYRDNNCHLATCFDDPKPGGETFWSDGCDPTQVSDAAARCARAGDCIPVCVRTGSAV